jgi:gliding motility-associated-like protein
LIQVHDTIGLYAGLDETIMKDQTVQLEASQHDSLLNYLWSPALGLSNDSIYNPIAGPKQTITYILRALNTYGCYEYDTLVVNVIPDLIFPTGITPNGDGVNDDWIIDYVDKFPDIEVEVYNRWGEQLFYSKGYPDEERWDGTFKGKDLPVGTYYYLIRLNDGVHNEPYSGPITIVR